MVQGLFIGLVSNEPRHRKKRETEGDTERITQIEIRRVREITNKRGRKPREKGRE